MPRIDEILDSVAEEFAEKVDIATAEMISSLRDLIKDKKASEQLEILSGINLEKAYELKLATAFASFESGAVTLLGNTFTTAILPESTLRALLDITKDSIASELTKHLSAVSMQGIMDGIASGKTVGQTLKTITQQIKNPRLVVNTAYSQFNNSLTTMLADELPNNTKWIYVGANDSKTRDRCREKIAYSGLEGKTKAEIRNRFGDMNNEIYRCRHNWSQRGDDPEAQNYNLEEYKD